MKALTEKQVEEQLRRNAEFQRQVQPCQAAGAEALDVRRYLAHYGISVLKEKTHGSSTLYCLEKCLFDESHVRESAIGQTAEGKLFYQCFHDSCKGRRWQDARQHISGNDNLGQFMPGCAERPGATSSAAKKEGIPGLIVPDRQALRITPEELWRAKLTPRCIVQDYLFADVAVLSAPGGTGKTTLTVFEAIHIVLGRRLYGLDVVNPGWCLFVTAEDSREILIARLREVAGALKLTPKEMQRVQSGVLFWDLSGAAVKLIEMADGNIVLTAAVDAIIEAFKSDPPAMILFDPIVSFGVGESRVNDNEQGLITAARRIRNGLHCAVRIIAHTGQSAAREKHLDQYAARGGTALPDGSRMSYVLQPWTPQDQTRRPPQRCTPDPEASITILARPKLSYSKPNLPLIWIKRVGWNFEHFTEIIVSEAERNRSLLDQVERFLSSQEAAGVCHTKTSLDGQSTTLGIARKEIRAAIEQLMAEGRVVEKELPKDRCQGGRKTFLSVSKERRGSAGLAENRIATPPENNPSTTPPPLREKIGGGVEPPNLSPFPRPRREDSAGFGGGWRG